MPEIRKVTIEMSRTTNVGDYESVRGGAATEFGLTSADLTQRGSCISKPTMKRMLSEASRVADIAADRAVADHRVKKQEVYQQQSQIAAQRERVIAKFQREKPQ